MVAERVVVVNEAGLHSRPADLFVRTAKLYACSIIVRCHTRQADAKNIIKVILLNVHQGDEIEIEAEGENALEAVNDLCGLVSSSFTSLNPALTGA